MELTFSETSGVRRRDAGPVDCRALGFARRKAHPSGTPRSRLERPRRALESVYVPGGTRIVQRGQMGVPFILVVHGGLRASFADGDGHRHGLFECFRGSTVGEAIVLSGRPAPLDLYAIRDSQLLCLAPEKFSALAARHPDLALSFARLVTTRLVDLLGSPEILGSFSRKTDRLPRSVALASVGGEARKYTAPATCSWTPCRKRVPRFA
jgi:CRP-like cAMP-binding protein